MVTRTIFASLVLLLAAVALSGCAADEEGTPTPTPTTTETPTPTTSETPTTPTTPTTPNVTEEYTLTTTGIPPIVQTGQAFTFTLAIVGAPPATSDHIGAHFANNTTAAPSPPGRGDCAHVEGAVPGVYNVTCTLEESGVWHVYGHMQTNASGTRENHWAEPVAVTAYDYDLIIEGVPANVTANETFTFSLNVTGAPASDSTHVGAHYSDNGTETPIASLMQSCEHFSESAPGNYTVSCTIATPGTWYIRGHYRLTEGTTTEDFWSAPLAVTVS